MLRPWHPGACADRCRRNALKGRCTVGSICVWRGCCAISSPCRSGIRRDSRAEVDRLSGLWTYPTVLRGGPRFQIIRAAGAVLTTAFFAQRSPRFMRPQRFCAFGAVCRTDRSQGAKPCSNARGWKRGHEKLCYLMNLSDLCAKSLS